MLAVTIKKENGSQHRYLGMLCRCSKESDQDLCDALNNIEQ